MTGFGLNLLLVDLEVGLHSTVVGYFSLAEMHFYFILIKSN